MSKNSKGIIAVVVVVVAAAGVYYFTHQGKSAAAKQIIKLNGTQGTYAWLMARDEGYVKAWAKALTKGETQFTYNNARYNTQGGTKIV